MRTLDVARTYRALRAATTHLPKHELLATDEMYGLLTLEYPNGYVSRLIYDGATASVIEPDATTPGGHRMLFVRNGYEQVFSPYD